MNFSSFFIICFLTGLSAPCESYVIPRAESRTSLSLCSVDPGELSEEPSDQSFNYDRRSVLGTCLAPLVLLPVIARSAEVGEADLDCLLDLPPVASDYVRVYFCRHGQTENNRLRKVQGARVDPPINDNGNLQATNLGKALSRIDECPQVFFSSNLQRAKMTADVAASQIDAKIKPRQLEALGEVDFGPVAEGQPVVLAKAGMQATYAAWAIGSIDYRPSGGGDSGRDVSRITVGSCAELV
jgi:hypothetical protein